MPQLAPLMVSVAVVNDVRYGIRIIRIIRRRHTAKDKYIALTLALSKCG